MKRRALQAVVVVSLAFIAACGGRVIIDEGENGSGGSSGSSSSSTSTSGNTSSGVVCSWPDPIGQLSFCGGSTGSGPGSECSNVYCDVNGNQFEALCQGASCQCRYNTQTMCTCVVSPPTDICAGGALPCCPIPIQP